MVRLAQAADINPDALIPERDYPGQEVNYFDISCVENHSGRILEPTKVLASDAPSRARRKVVAGDLLISTVRPNLRAFGILRDVPAYAVASTGFAIVRARKEVSDPVFLLESIRSEKCLEQLISRMEKGSYPSVNQTDISDLRLPLPPLETQQTIAAEIEAEQALVAANRELITRFETKIETAIDRVWGEAKGSSKTSDKAA